MQNNVLIGVLLGVAFSIPVFAWLFYLWYKSHLTQTQQECQIFERRSQDRAQANYESANEAPNYTIGPYFTPRGWVRPKTRGSSHALRPPQLNQANNQSAQTVNQQPNLLSNRQQRKQRALQNKQKQQEQQPSQNEQGGKQNRNNQRKQKNKNQGQNKQKSPTAQFPKAQSPKPKGGHGEQHNQRGNTEGQNDQRSNHDGGTGWGNGRSSWDNPHNTSQKANYNNNNLGGNVNHGQGEQRNSRSRSPRRNSRDNQENHGWGTSDHGAQQNSDLQSHHSNEDHHHPNNGWGDDYKSQHKESKSNWCTSPEPEPRGQSSPNRDWGHNDDEGRRNHSRNSSGNWGHAEEHRGGDDESWRKDANVYGDKKKGKREKKKKKERWQIELEENMKRGLSRSPSRGGSDRGWDARSRASGWKETQDW